MKSYHKCCFGFDVFIAAVALLVFVAHAQAATAQSKGKTATKENHNVPGKVSNRISAHNRRGLGFLTAGRDQKQNHGHG